ncbi:flagellar hook-basal body complex protein FliE [Primorskyibacter sp. S187A]|uniref:flagellar hook-basal body complex protein FliE n=1 Tax=Primorskyibacter sp. S187A TaxID=3415130 RepID=UPI003C7CE219
MDVRAIAAQKYAAAKPATEARAKEPGLGETLAAAAKDFTETLQTSEQTAKAAMVGDADPHALVQALSQSELAIETVVAVRDKVVEAYQEILRMPV